MSLMQTNYKSVCVEDKFSKPSKSYFEDVVCNFINSMLKESKYCSDVMKKHFNKEPVMTKKDDEDSESSNKRWICNKVYVDGDVKVRDYCHVTEICRGSAHINCNIKIKLNHKISIIFHKLKN